MASEKLDATDTSVAWTDGAFTLGASGWGKAVAVDGGGVVHAVWLDAQTTTYYASSNDGGATWTAPKSLGSCAGSGVPRIAASGSSVYVAFYCTISGDTTGLNGSASATLYTRRSLDGGATWTWQQTFALSDAYPFTATSLFVFNPSIAAADDNVYLVFSTSTALPDGSVFIKPFLTTSTDNGSTWSKPVMVASDGPWHAWGASVAATGDGVVHVAWDDQRPRFLASCPCAAGSCAGADVPDCPNSEVLFYRRSFDNGASFTEGEQQLTFTGAVAGLPTYAPSMAASGRYVHLAYLDDRLGVAPAWGPGQHWQVFYRSSSDGGTSWSSEQAPFGEITASAPLQGRVSLAASGASVRMAWMGQGAHPCSGSSCTVETSSDVYYVRSDSSGATWSSATRMNSVEGYACNPTLTISPLDGSTHVVWEDGRGNSILCLAPGSKQIYTYSDTL
jgi:hypothetical protein